VIEQVWEDCGHDVGVLIVGDPGKEHDQAVRDAEEKGMLVKYWEEVWDGAESSKKVMPGELAASCFPSLAEYQKRNHRTYIAISTLENQRWLR